MAGRDPLRDPELKIKCRPQYVFGKKKIINEGRRMEGKGRVHKYATCAIGI